MLQELPAGRAEQVYSTVKQACTVLNLAFGLAVHYDAIRCATSSGCANLRPRRSRDRRTRMRHGAPATFCSRRASSPLRSRVIGEA